MNRRKHLETIVVLILALCIGFWMVHMKRPQLGNYLLATALLLGLIGIFLPSLAEKIHWAWMKLAHAMGAVMGKVILTVVFFIIVVPMALLVRAFGKTGIKKRAEGDSYYIIRDHTYTKDSMENTW